LKTLGNFSRRGDKEIRESVCVRSGGGAEGGGGRGGGSPPVALLRLKISMLEGETIRLMYSRVSSSIWNYSCFFASKCYSWDSCSMVLKIPIV
jgi:hypothetical protein